MALKKVEVVAAVIRDKDKIFATQRGYGEFKDGWEFPGGKMEPGETPQQALVREIKEELDTEIEVQELIDTVEYDYPTFHLTMHCFWAKIKEGNLILKEHEAAKWLNKDTLNTVDWLPADLALVEKIHNVHAKYVFYVYDEKFGKYNEKFREVDFFYSNNTTVQGLSDFLEIKDIYMDSVQSITHFKNEQNNYQVAFNYIVQNGKVKWYVSLPECSIQDYLDTYKIADIIFYQPCEVGCVDFSQVVWEVAISLLQSGAVFGIGYVSKKVFSKIREVIKDKFVNHKRGCVSIKTVIKAIQNQDYWSLDVFKFEFDLEDNEETAISLLILSGYVFDGEKNLYFFNKTLAEKNEKMLEDAVEKYIASK